MLFQWSYVLLFCVLVTVVTTENPKNEHAKDEVDLGNEFSLWPSALNSLKQLNRRRRDLEKDAIPVNKNTTNNSLETLKENNKTITENNDNVGFDLSNPGAVQRGLVVFGFLTLAGFIYFIYYRRRGRKTNMSNIDISTEQGQFRYGILKSEEHNDKMELSRMPLTMDSDEEDDDLEIFDLQQKKSESMVNLRPDSSLSTEHTYDIDIVNGGKKHKDERLLVLLDDDDKNG